MESIMVIVRIASDAELPPETWAGLRALLPSAWESVDDGAYQEASRQLGRARPEVGGCSFRVKVTTDDDVETLLADAAHRLTKRRPIIARLVPNAAIDVWVRVLEMDYVGIVIPPDLAQKLADVGLSLIILPSESQ
jgi:hypothetical protein